MAYKPAITSMSLGRAWVHELEPKLAAAAEFDAVEVFWEDIEYRAKARPGGLNQENIIQATKDFKRLCDQNNLKVLGLQPFMHYEGLVDREEHERRIEKLDLWFQLVKILDTDTIQVPSNFLQDGITGDRNVIVKDFQKLADLGLQQDPPVRFAYENMCWGTFVDKWKQTWDIIVAVDRPNFGFCLDTFHIAGGEWADVTVEEGTVPNADEVLRASLDEMVKTIDPKKIFYVQAVDGEKMEPPLRPGHRFWVDGQPPRMSWSRSCRTFVFEKEGYMPVLEVLKAIVDPPPAGLGYQGWISMELFSRTMTERGPDVPVEHARRGIEAWRKLQQYMNWS